jgi:hypothetical protein
MTKLNTFRCDCGTNLLVEGLVIGREHVSTYISTDSEPGRRYELRVGSIEGQLYTLGSTVTELRKKVEDLLARINSLEEANRHD